MTALRRVGVLLMFLAIGPLAGIGRADPVQDTMKQWLADTASQSTIAPGTTITTANWQQYKQYMPVGMITLFQGSYFWKMPSDVQIPIGPTVMHPLPRNYVAASEKYGAQTRVLHNSDGTMGMSNYIAGMPFPNPEEPDKGYKILANLWFPGGPYLSVLSTESGLASFCTADRFGNSACTRTSVVYRQLAYNWAPGLPRTDPQASGAWFSEWLMVEQPEQSRYTADLTLFWQDLGKMEDSYVFVPALRRSLRLSTSARCAPLFGSDMVHDDQRVGYNGGLSLFDAAYLGTRKIIALTDLTNADGAWPGNYDMPLGWSKPSWGPWSLREVDLIDVRRVPSQQQGYCYGSKIMYVDHQFYHQLWEEVYDANMKLWKIVHIGLQPASLSAGEEEAPYGGGIIETYWDLQNDHVSHVFTANADGKTDGLRFNKNVPAQYDNVTRYSTPGGLMLIMR